MDSTTDIMTKMLSLSNQCDSLQHSGKYAECVESMEQLLEMKQNQFGEGSVECAETMEKLCEVLNFQAMISLQRERFTSALESLKRAEELSGASLKLKATTLNNLACFYRRTGKLRTAYNYLQNAFELELKIGSCPSLADTHLNLCAVLSQLDRHQQALEHSLLSIVLLQDEFLQPALRMQKDSQQQQKQPSKQVNPDRIAVLAIAFHNLGVELEHLKRYGESIQIYKRALAFAKDNLGQNHSLVQNLQIIVKSASVSHEGGKVKAKVSNVSQNRPRTFKEKPERLDKLGKDTNMIAAPSSTQSASRRNPSPSAAAVVLSEQEFNRNLPRFTNAEQLAGCFPSSNETDFNAKRIPGSILGQERVILVRKDHRAVSAVPRRKNPPQLNSFSRGENGYTQDFSYPQRNYSAAKTTNNNVSSQKYHLEYPHCKTENYNYELNIATPISSNNMAFDSSFKNDNTPAYNSYNILKQPLELTSHNIGYPSSCSSASQNTNQFNFKTNVPQSVTQNAAFLQQAIQNYPQQLENRDQPTFPIDASEFINIKKPRG